MRQGQAKRLRGRNRSGGGNNGGGNGGGGRGPNPLTRSYESNGPDVKIRGTAGTIADKYVQLSRDAQSSGDPVAAENYMQHAEHYYRLLAAAQAQYQPHQTFVRADADDFADSADFDDDGETSGEPNGVQPQFQSPQPFQGNGGQQQPYAGGGQPRQNGGRANGQVANGQPNARDGEQQPRRDRNERRPDRQDRPERDARQDRTERGERGERPARSEWQDRSERVEEPAESVGLPAFITGSPAPQPQPAFVEDAVLAPAPVIDREAVVAEASDDEPRIDGDDAPRAPARGRRRRYGRSGRGGAAGEEGETASFRDAPPAAGTD